MEPLTANQMYFILYFIGLIFWFTVLCLWTFASNTKRGIERIQDEISRMRNDIEKIRFDTWRHK